jgi:hypothetical protein
MGIIHKTIRRFVLTLVATTVAMSASAQPEHFHPKGKPPSEHTIAVIEQARTELPFSDKRDFELGFDIMPGTKGPSPKEDLNPYEVGPVDLNGEWANNRSKS